MALSTCGQQWLTPDILETIQALGNNACGPAKLNGHRVFHVLECQNTRDSAILRQWFGATSEIQHCCLPSNSIADRTDQVQQLLGTENQFVIFDATHGMDPRLLAASVGSLIAGGRLLLLTPPLQQWSCTYDHEYGVHHSYFNQRLANAIQRECTPTGVPSLWCLNQTSSQSIASWPADDRLQEQDELLLELRAFLSSDQARVLVIQADRGRGKSTLLARALLSEPGFSNTPVTALHQSATKVLQQHCAAQQTTINFLPLQTALQQTHECLFVDEAGAIPLPQLLELVSRSNKIVFATTVDGYEGAGRGFATRFSQKLDTHYTGWKLLQPKQAMRWRNGDPLEAFMNDTLLLKSALPPAPALAPEPAQIQSQRLSKEQLLEEPHLLESVYALLARAHYQTTAMDLRHMLDSPTVDVWLAAVNGTPVAAALLSHEGEIDESLYEDVLHKRRRIPHQLLPQLLTQCSMLDDLLKRRYMRVVRIAVHPDSQGLGIGSSLIQEIMKYSASHCEAIGTSYGADTLTMRFWLKQGFKTIHLGFKRNPRSGLPAVAMLYGHDPLMISAQRVASTHLAQNLTQLLDAQTEGQNTVSEAHTTSLIKLILADIGSPTPPSINDVQSQMYADGSRNFIDSAASVYQTLLMSHDARKSDALATFKQLANITVESKNNKSARQLNHQLRAQVQQALLSINSID